MDINRSGFYKDGYNINGVDKYGLDRNCNNINGIEGTKKISEKKSLFER